MKQWPLLSQYHIQEISAMGASQSKTTTTRCDSLRPTTTQSTTTPEQFVKDSHLTEPIEAPPELIRPKSFDEKLYEKVCFF
jgi:hypothetical protein